MNGLRRHATPSELARESHPGQILVLFAVVSVAMVGMLGLATDLGISFAGRRSVQNAADAAALAGARAVAMSVTNTALTAETDVDALTALNGFTFATTGPSVESCQYVDDTDTALGSCSGTVPTAATGVTVTVTETHPTYFIRVLPGAPTTATTQATATAHVMVPSNLTGASGPFIPCATGTVLTAGGTMDILIKVGGAWQINPSAVGQTFNIHDPNQHNFNKCSISSSQYKGVADQDANGSLTAPPEKYFTYATGNVSSISATVQGINGCQVGQPLDNCVAYLPIAVIDSSHPVIETGTNKKVWTIGFAAFFITQTASNTHSGKLLDSYIVQGPAVLGWTHGYFGPISIKLTG
jgi:Flp pilus assembly protein TadG